MLDKLQLKDRVLPRVRIAAAAAAVLTVAAASGCSLLHRGEVKAAVIPPVQHVAAIQPLDLTKVQPNEAGTIPVIMYHDIKGTKIHGLQYPIAMFKQDLQWLYDHNYRPISLTEFVQGKIDCPAGKSPVILTFDDGLKSQFNFTNDGKIDPDCAVGIMDAFHAAHPDWSTRATFFVLTDEDPTKPPPFYQKAFAQGKLEYLVKEGYDIGNHTVHHPRMNKLSDDRVLAEIAGGVDGIHKYLPDYDVNTLALPYGYFPKNRKLVVQGESGGVKYHNICAMAAAWRPVPSPMDKAFTPYHLERIQAGVAEHESAWWLNELEKDKSQKFVSDGDPNTYTINAMASGQLDKSRLQSMHFHLRTYNGTQLVASK